MLPKFIDFIKAKQSEIVLAVAVALIAIIAFESGKISALRNFDQPLTIKDPLNQSAQITNSQGSTSPSGKKSENAKKTDFQIIASKNSTIYHFFWCPGAKRIKEQNKISFSSEQEAQSRGYSLAANCRK